MHAFLIATWMTAAAAEEATDPPLAVPVSPTTEQHAPVPEPLAIPGPVRAAPQPPQQPSVDRLYALRQYQRERLDVRGEVEFHGGGARVHTGVAFGYGRPHHGPRIGVVVADPITTTRTWGVYKGPTRLDVPEFLGTIGDTEQQRQLELEITRAERAARSWRIVGGAGIGAMVVGYVGMNTAPDPVTFWQYNSLSVTGLIATVGGFAISSIPAGKALRKRRYPSESLGVAEAQRLADEHNDRLRQSLGLTPTDVWGVESQQER